MGLVAVFKLDQENIQLSQARCVLARSSSWHLFQRQNVQETKCTHEISEHKVVRLLINYP